jgi:hypothetical protein
MNSSDTSSVRPFPTLRTVLLVEHFLSNHKEDLFSKAAIIRGLGGKVNNASLTTILDYLEASNKVLQGSKGILWIASGNEKSRKLLKEALII